MTVLWLPPAAHERVLLAGSSILDSSGMPKKATLSAPFHATPRRPTRDAAVAHMGRFPVVCALWDHTTIRPTGGEA